MFHWPRAPQKHAAGLLKLYNDVIRGSVCFIGPEPFKSMWRAYLQYYLPGRTFSYIIWTYLSRSGLLCSCQKPIACINSWMTIPLYSQPVPIEMDCFPPARPITDQQLQENKSNFIFSFILFQIFKEGGPSASADFQGALRLHYNIILIKKKKKPNYKNLVTKSQYTNFFIKYYIYRLKD